MQLITLASHVLLSITLIAISGGVFFVTLANPGKTNRNRLLLVLWGSLFMWNCLAIITFIPITTGLRAATISIMLVSLFIYYIVIIEITGVYGIFRNLSFVLGFLSLAVGIMVWLVEEQTLGTINFRHISFASALTIFGGIAFWAIMSSQYQELSVWRLPSLFVFLALLSVIYPYPLLLVVGHLLVTISAIYIGWVLLQEQLFTPLRNAKAEINVVNSDLKRALNELASEKKRGQALLSDLVMAKEQKTNFLATMSHELRTPLNSIVGYSELLQEGVYGTMSVQQLDRLEKIHRNGRKLLGVITNILDLSKIEAGRLELDMQEIQPTELIENAIQRYQIRAQNKGLGFSYDIATEMKTIFADKERISQIVTNLVDNAIKFTQKGHVDIRAFNIHVSKGQSESFSLPFMGWLSDGNWLILEVVDTGVGIAPENQAVIFDEFAQIDHSRQREFEGTGLGLTITRKLVELHNGTIWVKSQEGIGSRFFVAIPSAQTLQRIDYRYQNIRN